MTISLSDAGKRFNREWIFRHVTTELHIGNAYAIIGPNGSGKSTLLQSIAGATALTEGKLAFYTNHAGKTNQDPENLYLHLSIAAPYLELIEEMSVTELLTFHQQFKPLLPGWSIQQIIDYIQLGAAAHKQIRYYSSGMKQRVKLAQAIFSDVPLLLLDEPCTNLDAAGYALYNKMVQDFCTNRLVVVSSNDVHEYGFCNHHIQIMDYK